jgi:hypothetical protein
MWHLDETLVVVRELEQALVKAGWHVALAGGTLHNGQSKHDLDLVVFPHTRPRRKVTQEQRASLARVLAGLLWTRTHTVEQMHRCWRARGSLDYKHVEVWTDKRGRRIDLLVLS